MSQSIEKGKKVSLLNILMFMSYSVAFIVIYESTIMSLMRRWIKYDETYSHGFLIIFIACYIIFENRRKIRTSVSVPFFSACLPLAIISFIWSAAYYIDIIIIQQLLLPILILCVIALTAGLQTFKYLLFPLCYLYFAIPIWDHINNWLLSLTVFVTGAAIQATGITALIEGDTITLPAGRIVVAGGCSGLSYFIVCLALTTLVSYFFIKTTKSKYLLMTLGMLLGLFVNWTRVYTIILIGYYSNMESKLIYDHELYGWVLFVIFFSPVFIILYRSGSRTLLVKNDAKEDLYVYDNGNTTINYTGWLLAFVFSILLPFALTSAIIKLGANNYDDNVLIGSLDKKWQKLSIDDALYVFNHSRIMPDKLISYKFPNDNEELSIEIGLYKTKENRKDFLPYNATLYDSDKWFKTNTDTISIDIFGRAIDVKEIEIQEYTTGTRSLLIYWYAVGGIPYSNVYLAKFSELHALLRGRKDAALVSIKSNCNPDCNSSRNNIRVNIKEIIRSIEKVISAS